AAVAGGRAGWSRLMPAYGQLGCFPPPRLGPVELETLIRRIAALEQRLPIKVAAGPPIQVRADADQLEQLLINLVRNAADAALETGGGGGGAGGEKRATGGNGGAAAGGGGAGEGEPRGPP